MRKEFSRVVGTPPHDGKNGKSSKRTKKKKPDCRVTVRLTQDERTQLKKEAGRATISEHIRWCALKRDGRNKRSVPLKDQEALGRVLGLLGQWRIANNLNQLAKQANAGSLLLDDETMEKIVAAYAHVCSMRLELLVALGIQEDRQK